MSRSADRVGQFEADIAFGPEALARQLDRWRPADLAGRGRLVLTGLGSSRSAALIAASALRARGETAWVEIASTSAPLPPADDLVLVAISASGRTREVIDAAERHRGTSLVVAVTNDPASRLASVADVVVPLEAGVETSGIACRTFRATITALALLTDLARPDDLRPAVDALAARHAARAGWVDPFAAPLDGAPLIDVLADASLLGLADQAALMLREAPRLPAHAWDAGEWLHTGVYLAFGGHRALLYPGAAADTEVIETVARRGGTVLPVEASDGDVIRRAIVDSIVAEVVAAALWERTTALDKAP